MLGVSGRIRFLGPRRDVPALLAAADFLLLPSRWEGMPYVVLEAMASARAVLATPVDGARELVVPGETGILAGAIDAPAIARGLAEMLALSPERRAELGAAGRELALAEYTLDRMIAALLAVYAEVA